MFFEQLKLLACKKDPVIVLPPVFWCLKWDVAYIYTCPDLNNQQNISFETESIYIKTNQKLTLYKCAINVSSSAVCVPYVLVH